MKRNNHIIKYEFENGKKLKISKMWCGEKDNFDFDFAFLSAQHAALSVGGGIQICKECIKAIIKTLETELMDDE